MEINHLRARLFSPLIPIHAHAPQSFFDLNENFPDLVRLVSGGNTLLFEVYENLARTIIAQTQDDSA
jgi:tRNA A37 threonylcarbamoyltransferase TsaD